MRSTFKIIRPRVEPHRGDFSCVRGKNITFEGITDHENVRRIDGERFNNRTVEGGLGLSVAYPAETENHVEETRQITPIEGSSDPALIRVLGVRCQGDPEGRLKGLERSTNTRKLLNLGPCVHRPGKLWEGPHHGISPVKQDHLVLDLGHSDHGFLKAVGDSAMSFVPFRVFILACGRDLNQYRPRLSSPLSSTTRYG